MSVVSARSTKDEREVDEDEEVGAVVDGDRADQWWSWCCNGSPLSEEEEEEIEGNRGLWDSDEVGAAVATDGGGRLASRSMRLKTDCRFEGSRSFGWGKKAD